MCGELGENLGLVTVRHGISDKMHATSVNNATPASPASQRKRGSASSEAAPGQVEPVRRTSNVKSVSIEDFLDGQPTVSEMVRVTGQ
jgi:hypothetical protein